MTYRSRLQGLSPDLLAQVDAAQREIDWVRSASAADLLRLATDELGLKPLSSVGAARTAVELGNLSRIELLDLLEPHFARGTSTASDLADQVQLSRAFSNPRGVTDQVADWVKDSVRHFPMSGQDIRVGGKPGDVLDPFILAAGYELLGDQSVTKTIEHTVSHKILMKIEGLVGHLHQNVIGLMRGNFRVPEPQGTREDGKEQLDPLRNPFPGADVGQVPVPERPDALRLFQIKSKTGTAKGGDAKRLGEQLRELERTYGADTFYVAIVGNTLRGHRSRGAVERSSPRTAVMVGAAAHNELTQSAVGAELLFRIYQRAFRTAARDTGYDFNATVSMIADEFETAASLEETDFLSAWLHSAVDGEPVNQDSRLQGRSM